MSQRDATPKPFIEDRLVYRTAARDALSARPGGRHGLEAMVDDGGQNGRSGRIDPLLVRRIDVTPDARGALVVVRLRDAAAPRVFAFASLGAARAFALEIWNARQAALARLDEDD